MDEEALRSAYFTLMVALGCAWACGLSPWLTGFAVGIILRFQDNPERVGGLMFLTSAWLLVPLAVLCLIEFVVDKWPRWDVRWHLWHGKPRIAAAVLLAWMAGGGGAFPLDVRIIVVILAAVAALMVHAARTSAHIAMHQAGTENFAVPLSGFVEEFLILSILLPLALGSPGLTTMMLGVISMAVALVLYLTWDVAKRVMLDIVLGADPGIRQPEESPSGRDTGE